jgi:hypothetical protein
VAGVDHGQGKAEKPGCRFYRLLPQKVSTGRKALKGTALKERRSPQNRWKVEKMIIKTWGDGKELP